MSTVHTSPEFGVGGAWLAEYTLTAVGAGVVLFDANGLASQWNAAAPALLGVDEQQLAGRSLHDPELAVVCPDRRPLTESTDPVRSVLTCGEAIVEATYGASARGGEPSWRSFNLMPVFGVDRTPRAVLVAIVDVHDRMGARMSEARWQLMAHSMLRDSLTADIVVDRAGTIIEWNDRALVLSGRSHVDMLGAPLHHVCDVDLDWVWEQVRSADDGHLDGLTFVLDPRGAETAVLSRFALTEWPQVGEAVMIRLLDPAWFAADGRSMRPMIDSRVFQHARLALCLVSEMGVILEVNAYAAALFGRSPSELTAQPVLGHLAGLSPDRLRGAIAEARRSRATVSVGTFLALGAGDGEQEVCVSLSPMDDGDAALPYVLVQLTEPASAWSGSSQPARRRASPS